MNRKTALIIAVLCGILASGCTSLNSKKLLDENDTPKGLTYRLPAKQFSIKATYQITGCKAEGTNAVLEADVSASFTESLIGAEAYTINYQDLNTWTKVTNTEFQLSETGLLTGVNATITDKSGTIIQNSVAVAASIARAVAFKPIEMAVGAKPETKKNPCNPVLEAVKAYKKAEKALDDEKEKDKERAKHNLKISQADLQIKALEDLVETYEKLGDKEEKANLLKRINVLEKSQKEAEAVKNSLGESQTEELANALAVAKGKISIVGMSDFVPSAGCDPAVVKVTKADLEKMFDGQLNVNEIILPEVKMTVNPLALECNKEKGCENSKVPVKEEIGIAYRIPVASVATVQCQNVNMPTITLLKKLTQVPQFGPIGSINLNNKMFDDNMIELAFNASTGTPSKLIFRAKSKAEAASATLRDAAGTYMQLQKDKRDDQITANKALLDQATAQVTLEKSKSELALSKVQAEFTTATTQAQMQQSLVDAQIELIRAQQRLDAVRTGTATDAEVELEALNTQERMLAERVKILKLEQEIAELKARASSAIAP